MKKEKFDLIKEIRKFFEIQPFQSIIPWAEKNINFSNDISAQRNFLDFSLYPYQKEPLQQWEDLKSIKTVTVVAPEQCGKTCTYIVGLLWRMVFAPCQSLIVYPSDNLASESNLTKIQPLMKHIPQLKAELEKPRAFRSDRYSFSNLISYFQGAGSKIVSKSCQVVIADEVDSWPVIGKMDNVADLKKRTRSYDSSISFLVCTPTEENGRIWKEFLKSSQGYWYLRCQHCAELTMRSCDIHNLQFESEYNEELKQYVVKPESIRLVCPKCGFEHTEDMKHVMNINGGYVHKIPTKLKEAPGFQIGALASQLPSLSWKNIANAQLEAGKKADIETQTTFDNSFRGLPFKRREVTKEDFEKLRVHCWRETETPSLESVEMIFMVADTQDDRSVVGIFALDVFDNLYLIESKEVQYLILTDEERTKINESRRQIAKEKNEPYVPVETAEDMLKKPYLVKDNVGITPTFALVDRQGHRTKEIQYFAEKITNVMMYQGTYMSTSTWRMSENNRKLILGAAKHWQTVLIYQLYNQKKRGQNYLYFHPDVKDDVIKQIVCVKPDSSKKFGDSPENWVPEGGAVHDWFDVVKMAYLAVDFAIQTMSKKRWRFCQSPALKRRWESLTKSENEAKRISASEVINDEKQNWFK